MTARPLVSYARYTFGDYLLQRAALPLAMIVFLGGIPVYATLHGAPPEFLGSARGLDFARQMFTSVVTLFLPLGAFLAVAGVMSSDRQHGYTRFYFSKPVNVLAYYGQAYCIHGATFIALFGLLTWGFGALTVHQSVHRAMEAAALTLVLVGGVGFLLGALIRFDGGVLALVYVVSLTLQEVARFPSSPLPGWTFQLARVLPPVKTLDDLRNHLYAAEALPAGQLWHVVAYGVVAFVLGLLALRRTPLSR